LSLNQNRSESQRSCISQEPLNRGKYAYRSLFVKYGLMKSFYVSKIPICTGKKTNYNCFRVPIHFVANRFTFEKFLPLPPLLHPTYRPRSLLLSPPRSFSISLSFSSLSLSVSLFASLSLSLSLFLPFSFFLCFPTVLCLFFSSVSLFLSPFLSLSLSLSFSLSFSIYVVVSPCISPFPSLPYF